MRFSYSDVWADTMVLLRAHAQLILPIAAVFILLPALAASYLLPRPQPKDIAELGPAMVEYARSNWHWLLLQALVRMAGTIAILKLIFSRGITVGGAIAAAAALLPFYFLSSLGAGFLVGLGFILLIVPGLYLYARMAPLGPVIVAEGRRNPIEAITRTFELTKGLGWALLGLMILVAVASIIVRWVITIIFGILLVLLAGQDVGLLLTLIVDAALDAAIATLFVLLFAAVYRSLATQAPPATNGI
jgi:uncharacterized membrane protein